MEVGASTRLFGGRRALRDRVMAEGKERGVGQLAWAATGLAALVFARCGIENGFKRPLQELLDRRPMETLSAVRKHAVDLAQTGCRTLGDVRARPRGGLARRWGKEIRRTLDKAYGHEPEVYDWEEIPEQFKERLELPFRVEMASALLEGAERLMGQMCWWLAARNVGVTTFTLHWAHDAMGHRDAGKGGHLTIGTADPSRDLVHLSKLLAAHLANVRLLAPVGDLMLTADTVHEQAGRNGELFATEADDGEAAHLALERVAAHVGEDAVKRCVVEEDHRQERMGRWRPASEKLPIKPAPSTSLPQPTWVLREPLKLAVRNHRPVYQGELQLLAGPQRIESGWWDRDEEAGRGRMVVRDYWLAESRHAGNLWVFQARLGDGVAWYLHGIFG